MHPTAEVPRSLSAAAISLCILLAAACGPPRTADGAGDPGHAGWIDLVDESHWQTFGSEAFPDGWVIEDGVLALVAPGAGDIRTRESFGDFELNLEWRISECGNSGIFYRGTPERPAVSTSPEMQVLDNSCHPDALNPKWSAGAVYDLYAPADDVTRPVGEWNEVRILAQGPHTELWLNGVLVAEYEQGSEEWTQRIAESKFHDWDGFGTYMSGPIALQDHGDPVWYREIRIRRLD